MTGWSGFAGILLRGGKVRKKWLLQVITAAAMILMTAHSANCTIIPVASGSCSSPVVALTFDDGPHIWKTPLLLDILDDLDIRATFFIVGRQAVQFPEILSEIIARGHGVANHSWSHKNMPLLDPDQIFDEIAFCSQAVETITGVRPRFFRPPGGNWNEAVVSIAVELGLTTILWSVNAYDTTSKSPEEIASSVVRNTGPGSIVLLHGGMDNTIEALPLIAAGLREKKLLFATLDQLFRFTPEAKAPIRNSAQVRLFP